MADIEAQTPYVMQQPSHFKDAETSVRSAFVFKVYGILTAQLLLTIVVAAPLQLVGQMWLVENVWLLYVSSAMTLATIILMICPCAQHVSRRYPTNYICLFTFTAFEGVVVGFVSAQYTWQSVLFAAGLTAGITGSMSAYAFFTKTDFTGFSAYLYTALMSLFGFGFVLSIMCMFGVQVKMAVMLYDICGVLVFTLFIVYDTQKILGGNHKQAFGVDDYVFAALNLYLDIINLFIYLLQLFGKKN